MLLFDWKKVYDTAEGNISSCILIMEMLIKKQLPQNKYDRIYNYSNKNFTGSAFSSMEICSCTIPISIRTENYAFITP